MRGQPGVRHWRRSEADGLRREPSSACGAWSTPRRARDQERALRFAERWVAIDPLHEPAHRELIRLYALSGDRGRRWASIANACAL